MTLGSGSLSAMGILQSQFREGLTQEEAVKIAVAAIEGGVYHDLGSGSNVDVCVIKKGKTEIFRNLKHDNYKLYDKPDGYKFKKERVQVLETYKHLVEKVPAAEPMQLC